MNIPSFKWGHFYFLSNRKSQMQFVNIVLMTQNETYQIKFTGKKTGYNNKKLTNRNKTVENTVQ